MKSARDSNLSRGDPLKFMCIAFLCNFVMRFFQTSFEIYMCIHFNYIRMRVCQSIFTTLNAVSYIAASIIRKTGN